MLLVEPNPFYLLLEEAEITSRAATAILSFLSIHLKEDPDYAVPILGGKIRFGVTVSEWGTDDKNVDLKDPEKFDVTVDGWTDDKKDAPLK